MKNEKLLDVIGNIDDNLVHNAVHDNFKKKKPVFVIYKIKKRGNKRTVYFLGLRF